MCLSIKQNSISCPKFTYVFLQQKKKRSAFYECYQLLDFHTNSAHIYHILCGFEKIFVFHFVNQKVPINLKISFEMKNHILFKSIACHLCTLQFHFSNKTACIYPVFLKNLQLKNQPLSQVKCIILQVLQNNSISKY